VTTTLTTPNRARTSKLRPTIRGGGDRGKRWYRLQGGRKCRCRIRRKGGVVEGARFLFNHKSDSLLDHGEKRQSERGRKATTGVAYRNKKSGVNLNILEQGKKEELEENRQVTGNSIRFGARRTYKEGGEDREFLRREGSKSSILAR